MTVTSARELVLRPQLHFTTTTPTIRVRCHRLLLFLLLAMVYN